MPDHGHVGRQRVAALVELRHLLPVAALAHGRRGRAEHVGPFVLDRTRVVAAAPRGSPGSTTLAAAIVLTPYCSTMPGVAWRWQATHSSLLSASAFGRAPSVAAVVVERATAWAIRINPSTMITATNPAISRRAERRRLPLSISVMPILPACRAVPRRLAQAWYSTDSVRRAKAIGQAVGRELSQARKRSAYPSTETMHTPRRPNQRSRLRAIQS